MEKVTKPYKFFTATDLLPEMNALVDKCADILGYPPTICRVLLHHFKWFDEALMEK